MQKKKVLILNPNMPPRAIRFLNLLTRSNDFDYRVYFYSVASKNRRWKFKGGEIKFKYEILRSLELGLGFKDYFPFVISFGFIGKLLRLRPDVIIIPGWADMPSYVSAIYCFFTHSKLILRSESTKYERSLRRTFLIFISKIMVRAADAFIASGTMAKKYLISLGADPGKVFVGFSPADVEYFQESLPRTQFEKDKIKTKLGISKRSKVVLFVGQLIVRKGIYDLIKSFSMVLSKDRNTFLVVIGYGPELSNLKRLVFRLRIEEQVRFIDFVPNQKLPGFYAVSDIFVLPSHEETWGVVVNEAMACSCPVVVSDRVGSAYDLVKANVTGMVYKSGDISELTGVLKTLLDNEKTRRRLAKNARSYIKNFGLKNLRNAMVNSIKFALS